MKTFGGLIVGLIVGIVAVLLAGRSSAGRALVARSDQTLQGFIDGVVEGFREPGRQ